LTYTALPRRRAGGSAWPPAVPALGRFDRPEPWTRRLAQPPRFAVDTGTEAATEFPQPWLSWACREGRWVFLGHRSAV